MASVMEKLGITHADLERVAADATAESRAKSVPFHAAFGPMMDVLLARAFCYALDRLGERVAALEAAPAADTAGLQRRLDELQNSALHDGGIFRLGNQYRRGAVATHHGQTWLAREDTESVPGSDATWRVFAHRGRDKTR